MPGKEKVDYGAAIAEALGAGEAGQSLKNFLLLYHSTSGKEREKIIRAMGKSIERSKDPEILAQLIYIATSLDLAQIEPAIEKIKNKPVANRDIVNLAIFTYFNHKQLRLAEIKSSRLTFKTC